MKKDVAVIYQPPTRVRYGVLGFACTLSMITYLDRLCWGSAAGHIVEALHLPNGIADLKWAATGFSLSYALFEIPSGWLGDAFGPKNVLIRILLWWSLFTALTGAAGATVAGLAIGIEALIVIRFLFGVGEAGAYPNITRALHNWFPFGERGMAQGAVWMSGRMMGGLTPMIWLLLVEEAGFSWRMAFVLFGATGLVWCLLFWLWFRNRPEEKAGVNEAEIALIGAGKSATEEAGHANVPWLRIFSSGSLWALCLMYFCASYGWYFNVNYLPNFLEEQYDVPRASRLGALYKGGPLWVGAFACIAGGYLTDRFIRRTGNRKWGRRLFGVLGHSLCGACFLLCLVAPNALLFFLAISIGTFFNDLTMGPSWAACQDIGRRYAAIVAACMNMIGNLGGAASAWATGTILEYARVAYAQSHTLALESLSHSDKLAADHMGYQITFMAIAASYFVAVLLWLRVDSTKPVVAEADEP
jgi:MFS family permease